MLLFFYEKQCYIYNSGVTLWTSNYGILEQFLIDIYRYVIGATGSITVIGLITLTVNRISKMEFIASWGRKSLQIYILQGLSLTWIWPMVWGKMIEKLGYNPLMKSMIVYWGITAIIAVIILLILSGIADVLKRLSELNRFLFGR